MRRWSIHDVVAHLIDSAVTTRLGFIVGLARARFDFDRQNQRAVRRQRQATPAETLERLRHVAGRISTPPAHLDSRLLESIVHGEDVRVPLGIVRCYPQEAVLDALRYQARTPVSLGGAKELLTDIRIIATDADVSIGHGSEVHGTALPLLMAISGRRNALDQLEGPGTAALQRLI